MLICIVCGNNRIPAPAGATSATRFTCSECTGRMWLERQTEIDDRGPFRDWLHYRKRDESRQGIQIFGKATFFS